MAMVVAENLVRLVQYYFGVVIITMEATDLLWRRIISHIREQLQLNTTTKASGKHLINIMLHNFA